MVAYFFFFFFLSSLPWYTWFLWSYKTWKYQGIRDFQAWKKIILLGYYNIILI